MRTITLLLVVMLPILTLSSQCKVDLDCNNMSYKCEETKCKIKNLTDSINYRDILFLISVFGVSILVSVSGSGGGVLYIPLVLFILNFKQIDTVALNSSLVFFGQFIKVLISYKYKHDYCDRSVIDWNILTLVVPSILSGTIFGVIFQIILPVWIVMVLFVIIIGYTLVQTIKKGIIVRKAEKSYHQIHTQSQQTVMTNQDVNLDSNSQSDRNSQQETQKTNNNQQKSEGQQQVQKSVDQQQIQQNVDQQQVQKVNLDQQQSDGQLQQIYDKEKKNFPINKVSFIVLQMLLFFLTQLFKGTKNTESIIQIKQCSSSYWIMYAAYIPIALISILILVSQQKQEYLLKKRLNYEFQQGDLNMEQNKNIMKILIICFCSGFFSSLFGIGGGVIVSPILMNVFNVPVIVTNYTVSVMCVITGGSSFFQYFIYGSLNIQYALVGAIFSISGQFLGNYYIIEIIKRKNKQSLIILVLCIAILIASVSSFYKGVTSFIEDQNKDQEFKLKFDNLC